MGNESNTVLIHDVSEGEARPSVFIPWLAQCLTPHGVPIEEKICLIFTVIIGVNLPRISVVLSDSKIFLLGIEAESVPGQIYRTNQVIETLQVINKQMKVNMTHNQRNSCHYEQ